MVNIGDIVRSSVLPQLSGCVVRIINESEFVIKTFRNREMICHKNFWTVEQSK